MMKERISHAITSWLPLSTTAAGLAIMAGSFLNLPVAKTLVAAAMSGITTFSALLMRSYAKKEEQNMPLRR
ncbi:MAG: hypothetical protein DA330_01265 [Nitrososphaera sp.]|nr:hypothetical protein [Nitrososphaera sp.]